MKKYVLVLILILTLIFSGVINASVENDKKMYHTLFNQNEENIDELFTNDFLNQVPVSNIIQLLNQYKNKLGELKEIENNEEGYTLLFEKGTVPSAISVNSEQKIAGLWFGNMSLSQDDFDSIIKEFKNLDNEISVYVIKNNEEEIIALNENEKMGVASTFKIFVLKALHNQIKSTNKDWNDIVRLNEKNKSIPSGILQDWPINSPITVKTLANLMISQSDNTATDHLIDYIGRENIEKISGKMNTPFLKTTEFFKLKHKADAKIKNEYINGNTKKKREILKEISNLNIKAQDVASEPVLIKEVEWFFSTKQLANTMYDLKEAEALQINPGLANKNNWYKVGYKGGSEAGVLQYTHLLQKNQDSAIFVVSVTANSEKGLDTNKITELTSRLISILER